MERGKKKIYEFAIKGYSLDELLTMQNVSIRKSTLWVHELIEDGYIKTGPPPFKNYLNRSHKSYKGSQIFQSRFQEIQALLKNVEFPIPEPKRNLPFGANDWVTAAPKIVLTR